MGKIVMVRFFFLSDIFRQQDTPVIYHVLCFAITDNDRL